MAQAPASLIPSPGERGLAGSDRDRLAASVVSSWAMFTAMVEPLDLDAVTRAKGLTVREVVIPLGAWPDNRPLDALLDEIRHGVVGEHDQAALVDAVRAAHADEPDSAVRDALYRQTEQMESLLYGDAIDELGQAPVASMLGTLPLLSFLHAGTYPLATAALDLEQAGASAPTQLLDQGLLGLLDTIGALGARQGVTASLAAVTPTTAAVTSAADGAWRTLVLGGEGSPLDPDLDRLGPTVRGTTRLLLDVTSGRADVPTAVRRKELGVDDWSGLLALTPIVEQVPGIPGRAALVATARAASALAGALRLLGR